MSDIPVKDEYVVCTVEKIYDYGVEVKLEEYPNQKGFIPLNQIAARWVKNIRNFVKMGQIRVAKVIYLNYEKGQINCSFAMVQKQMEDSKLNEWRQTKRVQQLLTIVAQELKKSLDDIWDKITNPILNKYDSVYEGFQDIKRYGKDFISDVPEEYRTALFHVIDKNITINDKTIAEHIKIETTKENGLELIKEGFKKLPTEKEIKSHISYIGNGTYLIKCEARDYKMIEKYLTKLNDQLTHYFSKIGTIEIKREDK
jgi:translation initiation factor 2 subunit 1